MYTFFLHFMLKLGWIDLLINSKSCCYKTSQIKESVIVEGPNSKHPHHYHLFLVPMKYRYSEI